MESIKKYCIWGIFISILGIIAMSHNASAVQPVINLNNYELVYQAYAKAVTCEFINMANTITSGNNYCRGQVNNQGNLSGLTYIYTSDGYETKKGDILTFYLLMSMDNGATESDLKLMNLTNESLGWNVLDWKIVDNGLIKDKLYSTGGVINQQGLNYDLSVDFYEGYQYYRLYEISLISKTDGNKPFGLVTSSGSYLFQIDVNDALGAYFRFRLSDFKLYRFSGDEANKEVQEKTQGAVDDSQAAGGSSSQNAQTGTTGLLNAITGAVSVISSASPTNCKINGNMGNLDMGQLDLCANPAPAFVQTIGSLILILMCVPLAISLFNRFIAIFRSFQS